MQQPVMYANLYSNGIRGLLVDTRYEAERLYQQAFDYGRSVANAPQRVALLRIRCKPEAR